MRLMQIRIALWLTLRGLVRRRIVLLLVFIVPTLFTGLVLLTTTDAPIQFLLPSIRDGLFVAVPQRDEGLVFVGLVAVGVLTAFLALDLVQGNAEASRRLIVCGYRPAELIVARLGVLLLVIVSVSVYVTAIVRVFIVPERTVLLAIGLAVVGWVYGCYGLMVGSLCRRELEGILFVVLLANIDAGWLQNPIYYAEAQNQAIIRSLPAYFPAQASMTAAFTTHSTVVPILASIAYGFVLLLAAILVYAFRVRTNRG